MLSELAIKNFAIINDIRISFSNGLSVLTGETGAGKSIIIEAVNLLLGSRASSDLVRTGEDHAELEAVFDIDPASAAGSIMKEQDMDPGEGLMIRRIISTNGRHKVFINSRQSTMQLLKQVTHNLAGISSQHAHQGLLNQDTHLYILDRFAKTYQLRRQVTAGYNELVPMIKELKDLKTGIEKTAEENEFLQFQILEIEEAALLPEEDKILEQKRFSLKNGSEILDSTNRAVHWLYSKENSVIETLGTIKADFEKKGVIDPELLYKAEKVGQAIFDLEDLTDDLRSHAKTIELDPEVLDRTEARLDVIQKLKRKYGGTLETLFATYDDLKQQLASTETMAGRIKELDKKSIHLSKNLAEKALLLSDKRKKAAKTLAKLAENELKELEMVGTRFTVLLKQPQATPEKNNLLCVNGRTISSTGIDTASFLMAPNPGEEPRPLNRIASGGELSRVVLALKAILSETESLGTLVFDEVDAGIGGKTSEKVGQKLKNLSARYQVICITHLAQIAKYGTSHFNIKKSVTDNRTSTSITALETQKERINEIARMIGGEEITQATLVHAKEMLTTSAGTKSGPIQQQLF